MAKANGARRVVVTGTGVVTPIGLTVDTFWEFDEGCQVRRHRA